MNLIILDQNFDTLGVVSVFNTLIWDRRYYASGLFELHTPAEFFTLMNTGRYLYRNDRDELGVIREVNFARDAKGTRTAYCTAACSTRRSASPARRRSSAGRWWTAT